MTTRADDGERAAGAVRAAESDPHPLRLQREQWLDRPCNEVFAFFADAGNLEAITPPWLRFRILTPRPIEMRAGTLIDYALRIRGCPVRWRTRIELWEPPLRFIDCQLRGPYRVWRHLHEFFAEGDRTRMVDTVDYALPWGLAGTWAHRLWVRSDLERIFDYRRERIEQLFRRGR